MAEANQKTINPIAAVFLGGIVLAREFLLGAHRNVPLKQILK